MASSDQNRILDAVSQENWAQAAAELKRLDPAEVADLFLKLPFEQQQTLFGHLPLDFAAKVVGHFPYYHQYVLLHSRGPEDMRAIVDKIDPDDRMRFFDELPEEAWQHLMNELSGMPVQHPQHPPIPAATPKPKPPRAAVAVQPIIEAKQVGKFFQQPDGNRIEVIAPTDLTLEPETIIALLGPSGSGKSTLLRMLSGLSTPSSGQVLWHGKPLEEVRPNVAIVFQSFALFPWLTVVENVEAPLLAQGMPKDDRETRALRALDSVGLKGFENAYPKELSGGMKQRVGFARALAVEPEVLFMDEPFSALDVLTAENLRSELMELWMAKKIPTKSIFLVTHNIEEAVLLADRIIVLGRNPARIRANFRVNIAQPRERSAAEFTVYVDYIYKVMTQPEADIAFPTTPGKPTKLKFQMLPHARPGGIAGLLGTVERSRREARTCITSPRSYAWRLTICFRWSMRQCCLDLPPCGRRVGMTAEGKVFAEATFRAEGLFRDAALKHVTLLQRWTVRSTASPITHCHWSSSATFSTSTSLRMKLNSRSRPLLNWGRYAEIFDYDSEDRRLILMRMTASPKTLPASPVDAGATKRKLGQRTVVVAASAGSVACMIC